MLAYTQLKQVVSYIPEALKEQLTELKIGNRRLSESALVEEALEIAMPTLRQRHLRSFHMPARTSPGKKHRAA
jgi:hypothetical protein